MKDIFSNSRTLNHSFFKNPVHFINYCTKIYKGEGLVHERLSAKFLDYFAWSLIHEDVFKSQWVKPPYAILITSLKGTDETLKLDYTLGEYLDELILLREGKIGLKDSNHISKFEHYPIGDRGMQINTSGLNPSAVRIFDVLKDRYGVYKFFDADYKLLYIGKSYHLGERIPTSLRGRKATYFSYIITETQADANILEQYFIATEKPLSNGEGLTIDLPTFLIDHKYIFCEPIRIYTENIYDKILTKSSNYEHKDKEANQAE